jgi:acyl-[acyl-carrier-protein]-phospholipid O-acyltransferase / long-chain-fatty-acid--[acyl-carrier-protein] ligase
MIQQLISRNKSFNFLNYTQFLGALNDNIFRGLVVYYLIDLLGSTESSSISSLAGAVFVAPFLLFSYFSGILADRFNKDKIIRSSKKSELFIMLAACIVFMLKIPFLVYGLLFCMALQSTFFGPAKYSIIAEIVPGNNLLKANGKITLYTYVAIIFGTFLAAKITDLTGRNFIIANLLCVSVSILGIYCSKQIKAFPKEKSRPTSQDYLPPAQNFRELIYSIHRTLLMKTCLVASGYFMFMGGFVQMNIIPFAIQHLGGSDTLGGYLFLVMSLGIGLGSGLVGRFSKSSIPLSLAPIGGYGVSICCFLVYFFAHNIYIIGILLILLGFFGGIYTVPVNTYVQISSSPEERGRNVSIGNFLSFLGVLIASAFVWLCNVAFHYTPAQSFLIMGLVTGGFSTFLMIRFKSKKKALQSTVVKKNHI